MQVSNNIPNKKKQHIYISIYAINIYKKGLTKIDILLFIKFIIIAIISYQS
jgi:hypothetical protein